MRDMLYGIRTINIVIVLFLAMILAIEVGHYIGRVVKGRPGAPPKEHVSSIQAALLGMLALLMGFTLSLSLQRFDSRSAYMVEEANAIGTAYLRTQFLPLSVRDEAQRLFREYTGLRVEAGNLATIDDAHRSNILRGSNAKQDELWALSKRAVEEDANPVRTGLFVQALNDAIDASSRREEALNRHIPDIVLILLFGTFLMVGLIVGYSSGIGGYRAFFATYVMLGLIVVLVFIIIDVDRPRRGLVEVKQASMINLLATMQPGDPARH